MKKSSTRFRLSDPFRHLLWLTALLLGGLTTQAQTTWTGTTDSEWTTPANWSAGVPDANDDVTIPNVTNDPVISTAAVAGSIRINPGGLLTINAAASLTTTPVTSQNFVDGTLVNYGTFTVTAGTNIQDCLYNTGTVQNKPTGTMRLNGAWGNGIWNFPSGIVTNEGTLILGDELLTGTSGILNLGTLTNTTTGLLQIDRSRGNGIANTDSVTNSGVITIGSLGVPGANAILNINADATFTNEACGIIRAFANVLNSGGTLTNKGYLFVNSANPYPETGIAPATNDGIIAYPQGNPIPNVTNNDLIVAPVSGCEPTVLPALQIGGSNSFTAGGTWYQDEALTQVAGTYNPGTNAFTATNLAAGTHTLYFAATDNANGCTRTVSIRVELRPTAFTQGASVSGGPVCAGQTVTLSFDASECLKTGNTFTAQLSDASGAFGSPTHLGPVSPGINPVMIPAGTPFGTGYRIRVVAANPAVTSPASEPFRVNALGNVVVALYPATPGTLCQGQDLPVTFSLSTPGACPFPADNVFTVELSNATGSFANPRTLGVASPGTTSFPASLLDGLPVGTGYRVRILSSNPAQASFPSYPFDLRGPSLASVTPGVGGAPVCRGQAVTVSFNLAAGSCSFPEGNAFTAQLSSATGSFASPVSLGMVQAGVPNSVVIPAGSAAGTGYRIRIVSSNPALTSLVSSPFRVNAVGCANSRLSAEEGDLVVAPNPVSGREIRVRVSGMDHPQFSLATASGRNVGVSVKTDGSGEFVLTPKQALPSGVYVVGASEGATRLTQRVLVSE